MPYVTSIERLAKEEGRREGLVDGIAAALRRKFGTPGIALMSPIRGWKNTKKLQALLGAIVIASTLEEIKKAIR
jgi:hypothetical protein